MDVQNVDVLYFCNCLIKRESPIFQSESSFPTNRNFFSHKIRLEAIYKQAIITNKLLLKKIKDDIISRASILTDKWQIIWLPICETKQKITAPSQQDFIALLIWNLWLSIAKIWFSIIVHTIQSFVAGFSWSNFARILL